MGKNDEQRVIDLTIIGSWDSIQLDSVPSNDDLFKKHGLMDGQQDILRDVLGLFGSGSSTELLSVDNNENWPKANPIFVSSSSDGSLNFCMEPLSTLLYFFDDADATWSCMVPGRRF